MPATAPLKRDVAIKIITPEGVSADPVWRAALQSVKPVQSGGWTIRTSAACTTSDGEGDVDFLVMEYPRR